MSRTGNARGYLGLALVTVAMSAVFCVVGFGTGFLTFGTMPDGNPMRPECIYTEAAWVCVWEMPDHAQAARLSSTFAPPWGVPRGHNEARAIGNTVVRIEAR